MATAALHRPDIAAPAARDELDRLGPVLCKLGHDRVTLSWYGNQGDPYYYVDGTTPEGKFFSGMGDTPSEALKAAEESASRNELSGVYLND